MADRKGVPYAIEKYRILERFLHFYHDYDILNQMLSMEAYMDLCDIHTIRRILGKHGFQFSKSLGQNFLTAQWVPEQIAEACGVDKTSGVVEVGPGMGCLTTELAKRAQRVTALELDRALFPVLEETLADFDNIVLVQGDVLKTNFSSLCTEYLSGLKTHVCANLPYYITTPAIATLLDSRVFASITVMVQREVAQRICASAGTAEYSAFSIYVQYYAQAEILFGVPAACFIPRPKVDSAVIRLVPRGQPAVHVQDETLFFALVRAAFNQRRKVLANAAIPAFGGKLNKAQLTELIISCGFDERVRGERLTLEDFANLTNRASELLGQV